MLSSREWGFCVRMHVCVQFNIDIGHRAEYCSPLMRTGCRFSLTQHENVSSQNVSILWHLNIEYIDVILHRTLTKVNKNILKDN